MTTDVKEEPETKTTTETVVVPGNEPDKNQNDELLSKLGTMFDEKIKKVTDEFNDKFKKQEEVIKEKDEQIEKLKQANANMALTGNFSGETNGKIDYSTKDFDEVDFDPQAKSFLDNIDKKVFDIKPKTN